ncbi:hypothetical protein GPN87_004482 [Salmonella enterica]|uniref:Uncharacterized protein n=1 Tax=Salmonella enterica subsp. enterica serovar Adjame TaxID=2021403 RepID=A0A5H6NZL5_SALET|nr:hypothetical protein [Salmonella enterica subsp. enterica serovar Telelkebir]EAA4388524.1 hypothetical protein [Salmonella enterica subsp. enterica serovar Adjame]EAB5771103.1 hypothetical protein [Salmonella enterica subsp. enterica serovar Warnow]EAB8289756.1 hypothetical protein [Salmonella enterica subsp. enterica serovar Bracknell]EAO0065076.1 hypothetical protein [Salmonella enterica]EBF9532973.1 hypothetical protein [Salmonella enterica subsp. enterica serovar Ank]EBZ5772572.1 hypot
MRTPYIVRFLFIKSTGYSALHVHYCSLKYTGSHRFLWVKTPVFCIAHDAIETLCSKSCLNQKLSLC